MEKTTKQVENCVNFTWNIFPNDKNDLESIEIPLAANIQPFLIERTPLVKDANSLDICESCKAFKSNWNQNANDMWECSFCNEKNCNRSNLTVGSMPLEINLHTVQEPNLLLFVLDLNMEEEELIEVKESIQMLIKSISNKNKTDTMVGFITYNEYCQVYVDIHNQSKVNTNTFNGYEEYTNEAISDQLFLNINESESTKDSSFNMSEVDFSKKSREPTLMEISMNSTSLKISNQGEYFASIQKYSNEILTFLDSLSTGNEQDLKYKKEHSCFPTELALKIAISLIKNSNNEKIICNSQVLIFQGCKLFLKKGNNNDSSKKESLKSVNDLKINRSKNYVKINQCLNSQNSFTELSNLAIENKIVINLFSTSKKTGIFELYYLIRNTGGAIYHFDSFARIGFKDTLHALFEIKSSQKSNCEMTIICSQPIIIKSILGNSNNDFNTKMHNVDCSLYSKKTFFIGGSNQHSTYTVQFDIDSKCNRKPVREVFFQIILKYLCCNSNTMKMRILSQSIKSTGNMINSRSKYEIIRNLNIKSSMVVMGRLAAIKLMEHICCQSSKWTSGKGLIRSIIKCFSFRKEDEDPILSWIEAVVMKFLFIFSSWTQYDLNSFQFYDEKVSKFCEQLFYLTKSFLVDNNSISIDELSFYISSLMIQSEKNCLVMLKPDFYTLEFPETNLIKIAKYDLALLNPSRVILMDDFFTYIIWIGNKAFKDNVWEDRKSHSNLIEEKIDMFHSLVLEKSNERNFHANMISCDETSIHERIIQKRIENLVGNNEKTDANHIEICDFTSYISFIGQLLKKITQRESNL